MTSLARITFVASMASAVGPMVMRSAEGIGATPRVKAHVGALARVSGLVQLTNTVTGTILINLTFVGVETHVKRITNIARSASALSTMIYC